MLAKPKLLFNEKSARSAAAWIVVFSFFAALWFPLFYAPGSLPIKEIATGHLTKAGDGFENAFPFRITARLQFNELRYALFRALPPQLLEGRDGWIFYRSEVVKDGEVLTDFLGRAQPTAATVSVWCDTLAKRRLWLNAHGATSLVVVVPNKETVYADMLPDDLVHKRGRTRLDALMGACGQEVVDLRAPLLKARDEHRVYYRSGTHWTSQGAYIGYEAILEALAKAGRPLTPIPRASFVLRPELNVDSWIPEKYRPPLESDDGLDPTRSYPACYRTKKGCVPLLFPGWRIIPWTTWSAANPSRIASEQRDSRLPAAVVFHDSFVSFWLAQLLAQHFRRVVFAAGGFDQALIDSEHPDVVIGEAVERYLIRVVQ
jgi:hypothetical protein